MNPIYKFDLITEYNGVTNNYAVYPLHRDLAKEYDLQQNQKFYRAKLSGKLIFSRTDYFIIANARFETKFSLVVSISWDNGQTWVEYWRGAFWKTDCKFDMDAQTVEVMPAPVDDYTDVLAGMEKEYNLIDLKPEIENLTVVKRPLIQMYVPGENVVSCFLSGMSWEQDCEVVTNENTLINQYHFSLNSQKYGGQIVSGTGVADGLWENGKSPDGLYEFQYERVEEETIPGEEKEVFVYTYLTRISDGVRLYANRNYQAAASGLFSMYEYGDIEMTPVAYVSDVVIKVYARYLLDVDTIAGESTHPIPANDIVENNRNYHRVIGYGISDVVYYSNETTNTPTEWGIRQPGEYWKRPSSIFGQQFYSIGRSQWANFSIWFAFSVSDELLETKGRKAYTLKDAYPLYSVISVLLREIAPGITHEPTSEYSQFLYDDNNPVSGDEFDLYITQKSNILAGDYSQPAQKAPITLKMVTDMLRDCYRAYWYVEDGKFKIEHIQWFKNGGSYIDDPAISHDLTVEKVTRNGKSWAYATSQYEYNKPTMPERYQFGWMDDVSKAFEGYPIEIISKYVTPGNIEDIKVSNFTSDIDYMLLNPGACSKDGFALMAARQENITTPDTEFVDVPYGIDYGLRYALNDAQQGDSVTIKFIVQGFGTCRVAFLRNDGTPISIIGIFEEAGIVTYTEKIPQDATQIGISSIYRMGFVKIMMLGIYGKKYLPFVSHIVNGVEYRNQNGLLAFINLQPAYYLYDMPSYQIRVNEVDMMAYGITREKKQTLRMPVVDDPNPNQLIKTFLGTGQIEKISVNLSSRNANVTLMYDTQNYNE